MTIFVGQRVRIRAPYHLAGHSGIVHETYTYGSVEVELDGGSSYFVCGARAEAPDAPTPEQVLETQCMSADSQQQKGE